MHSDISRNLFEDWNIKDLKIESSSVCFFPEWVHCAWLVVFFLPSWLENETVWGLVSVGHATPKFSEVNAPVWSSFPPEKWCCGCVVVVVVYFADRCRRLHQLIRGGWVDWTGIFAGFFFCFVRGYWSTRKCSVPTDKALDLGGGDEPRGGRNEWKSLIIIIIIEWCECVCRRRRHWIPLIFSITVIGLGFWACWTIIGYRNWSFSGRTCRWLD